MKNFQTYFNYQPKILHFILLSIIIHILIFFIPMGAEDDIKDNIKIKVTIEKIQRVESDDAGIFPEFDEEMWEEDYSGECKIPLVL